MKRVLVLGVAVVATGALAYEYVTSLSTIDTHSSGSCVNMGECNGVTWPAAATYGGYRHLFDSEKIISSQDSTVRWCKTTGTTCSWSVIDGAGGSNGELSTIRIASMMKALEWNSNLHLFYVNRKNVYGMDHASIRHGVYNGTTWVWETIDGGGGGSGATSHNVGGYTIAAAGFSTGGTNWLFVAFGDNDDETLRLGWTSTSTGNWSFQVHDGAGGSGGKITAALGDKPTFVVGHTPFDGGDEPTHIHLFYDDSTNHDLRHSWWGGSGDWGYATHDGNGNFTSNNVATISSGVLAKGRIHLFYEDYPSGDIIHSWDGVSWSYQTFASTGSLAMTGNSASCFDGTNVHTYYYNGTGSDLHEAYGDPTVSWTHVVTDGDGMSGRSSDSVGIRLACVPTLSGQEGVLYWDGSTADLKLGVNVP